MAEIQQMNTLTQIECRNRIEGIIKAKYNFKGLEYYPENDEEDTFMANILYNKLTAAQDGPYLTRDEMLKLNKLWKKYNK